MTRSARFTCTVVLLACTVSTAQSTYTVNVNGTPIPTQFVQHNGQLYLNAQQLLRALGVTVKVDHAKRTITIAGMTTGSNVHGTTQLDGLNAVLGTTYTIGKSNPLNFTLRRAEFTVARVNIGTSSVIPKSNEKLLVLHYTVHNPQPREVAYGWSDIRFTAVDAKNANREFEQVVGHAGTGEALSIRLKPAQRVDAYAVIRVPAEGVVPKLIATRESGAPVLRYELTRAVEPLQTPFAHPSDASGATARDVIPALSGQWYPLGAFDARVDALTVTTTPIKGRAPATGKQYLVASVTLRNKTTRDVTYAWSNFKLQANSADSTGVPFQQSMLTATRDEEANGRLAPSEEVRVRFYAEIPATGVVDVHVKEGSGRTFLFPVK